MEMVKPALVITTIFPPSEAIRRYALFDNINIIIVGDKKTPPDWSQDHCQFLSITDQEGLGFDLPKKLPFNHYSRKMIGYLYAISKGAERIIDTDDDNIPAEEWGFPSFEGTYAQSETNRGFVNIYSLYSDKHIWPRGFPLQRITSERANIRWEELESDQVNVGIWQGLADRDPDVDAIYRLTDNSECVFEDAPPIVLNVGTLSPFNSQNTVFRKELFPLLYLPALVTFRFTDILRGLVAQPILWLYDYRLGFTKATVVQERNLHDYISDFEQEIPCYLLPEQVIKIVTAVIEREFTVSENLFRAYSALYQEHIVEEEELALLKLWLSDLARMEVY